MERAPLAIAVALDISGRPFLVWKLRFTQEKLGEWDTELVEHWFHSVAQAAGITLHVQLLYGQNNHHLCEAAFKGFARAMRQAAVSAAGAAALATLGPRPRLLSLRRAFLPSRPRM